MQNLTLTSEEKHQLLSVLREFDREAPLEQRGHLRRKVQLRTLIRVLEPHGAPIKSVIVNVSAKGAAILLSRPLARKSKFILPLRFSDGGGWLVLCEVRNCVPQPTPALRQWKIGARFLDRIDDPRGTAKPPLDWLM